MILQRFLNSKTVIQISIQNLSTIISSEQPYIGSMVETNGRYEFLNDQMIGIFSSENKNYLLLKDESIELTPDFDVQFQVAQSETEESWFKIYNGKELVYEQKYINPHPPFVLPDPFEYDPDFNTTNFAYHLAQYIQKVKDHPGIVLFENAENG